MLDAVRYYFSLLATLIFSLTDAQEREKMKRERGMQRGMKMKK